MSTHTASAAAAERVPTVARYSVLALGLTGATASVLAGVLVWDSPLIAHAHATAVVKGVLVASYVAVGTYTWLQRRSSRLGPLIVAAGFLYTLTSLAGLDRPLPFTLGRIALAAQVLLLAYVFVSFPRGAPSTSVERLVVACAAGATAAVWTVLLAFADTLPHGGPLTDCSKDCPANAFQLVETSQSVTRAFGLAATVLTVVIVVALIGLLARKAASETLIRSRAVTPLIYSAILLAATYATYSAVSQATGTTPGAALRLAGTIGAFAIPAGLLLGQLRGRLFAATNLWRTMGGVPPTRITPAWMERFLGETLGDPSLVLALWSNTGSGYVDVHGERIELPDSESRSVTKVGREGSPSLALIHDPMLDDDRDLVRGVGATADVLLENATLVKELQASRARIVDSAERERRRLERDLHDGAQQRLTAIQLKLAIASEETDAVELRRELDDLAEEAAAAANELRTLSHGIYPPLLYDAGLAPAIRSMARLSPIAVRMVDRGIGRAPAEIELAIYYCVLEALQNAARHAGREAAALVILERSGTDFEFEVRDDGEGFDPGVLSDGMGLVSMRDRIGAVGGRLEIRSAPGMGTTIRGIVGGGP